MLYIYPSFLLISLGGSLSLALPYSLPWVCHLLLLALSISLSIIYAGLSETRFLVDVLIPCGVLKRASKPPVHYYLAKEKEASLVLCLVVVLLLLSDRPSTIP